MAGQQRKEIDEQELVRKLMEAMETYENASRPQIRYRAESQICRLVDRLGASSIPRVYGCSGSYTAKIERFGSYRIPCLEKYD